MKYDWEHTPVTKLSPEEIEDGLADPELGDAADWIFKLCMLVLVALRKERVSCEWEFSPVAEALVVGGERERLIAHAFSHLAEIVLRHSPGCVPYTRRVVMMRQALLTVQSELMVYWRAPSAFVAFRSVRSFLHEMFQSRYVLSETAKWRDDVLSWRDRAVEAVMALAAEYAAHYNERLDRGRRGGRPQSGSRPAFSQAAVALLCGRSVDTVARWENGAVRAPLGYTRQLRELGGVAFFDFVREYRSHFGTDDVFARIRRHEVVYTEGLTERERGLVEAYVTRLQRGD